MTAVFVTSTGTDIGKTFVSRGMIEHLRARGRSVEALKPVVTGYDPRLAHASDTGRLLAALGRALTPDHIDAISPFRLREPVSPDLAARRENASIDFDALNAFCRNAIGHHRDALIIEGVGGIMVPLDERHTVLDLITQLRLPLLLVAGTYVGTISHTLTALHVLARRNLDVAAVIVSESVASAASLKDTVATIARFSDSIEVVGIPRLADAATGHPAFAAIARLL